MPELDTRRYERLLVFPVEPSGCQGRLERRFECGTRALFGGRADDSLRSSDFSVKCGSELSTGEPARRPRASDVFGADSYSVLGVTKDAYSIELNEIEAAAYGNVMQPYDLPIRLRCVR
jgi:hypothetical protein